jgi:hypothetical protein
MPGACGVIDTACGIFVFKNHYYFTKFKAEFKKALTCESGPREYR